ncbi:MAG: ThiF family adenylyltransferase, partial [Planctomycetota bacterium]
MTISKERIPELQRRIRHVSPREARRLADSGAALLDVREVHETLAGAAEGALQIPRALVERQAPEQLPDKARTVCVYCGSGVRSLFAAETLENLGYRDVRSVEGGFTAWKAAGLPATRPPGLSEPEERRYARHLVIPEVGVEGQARLKAAKALLVGAGGLGSPAAVYLACAGVGTLGVVDSDAVDESNLQRQILHDSSRVGMRKTESARRTIAALNPLVDVVAFDERLTSRNVDRILPGFDLVLDGADNFATRY